MRAVNAISLNGNALQMSPTAVRRSPPILKSAETQIER